MANLNKAAVDQLAFVLPNIDEQRTFLERKARVEMLATIARDNQGRTDLLFTSLQHRAFSGQL